MELCKDNEKENELTNPTLEIIRKCVDTKLFRFAMVAFSVAVLLNVANIFVKASLLDSPYLEIFTRVGINAEFYPELFLGYYMQDLYVVPPVVLAFGIWITYFSMKNESICRIKSAGFKIIRVMMVTFIVLACLGFLRSGIAILALSSLWGGLSIEGLLLALVIILLFGVCIGFMALYYLMVFKLLGKVNSMMTTGVAVKIPCFVAFASLALGCFSVLHTFVSVFSQLGLRYTDFADVCMLTGVNLTSALATILFGAFLLSFGRKINAFAKNKADSHESALL